MLQLRPAHFGAQGLQRLDQHGGLDRHVQRPGDARAAQRLLAGEFLADRHQARHLRFGDADFLAAPVGELEVGNDEIAAGFSGFEYGAHLAPSFTVKEVSERRWNGRRAKAEPAPRAWQAVWPASQRSSKRTRIVARRGDSDTPGAVLRPRPAETRQRARLSRDTPTGASLARSGIRFAECSRAALPVRAQS